MNVVSSKSLLEEIYFEQVMYHVSPTLHFLSQ